jgi:hypothetical protein
MTRSFMTARAARAQTLFLAVMAALSVGAGAWRHLGPVPGSQASAQRRPAAPALLQDATRESGIDFIHITGGRGEYWIPEEMGPGAAFFDYDGDDDLDIYLVQGGSILDPQAAPRNRLLRNTGGRFEDVSAGSGADIAGYGMGCAAADYDNDWDVDLFVTRLGSDALLRNNGDGTFTESTSASGIDSHNFGSAAVFFDYDLDGWLDLFAGHYLDWSPQREVPCFDPASHRDFCSPVAYAAPGRNRLFHNRGDGTFEDVTDRSGIGSVRGNTLGASASDFDGDGWTDLFVACDQTPGLLWMNRGDGTFVESAGARGCAFNSDGVAIAGMGVATEDLDGDGDLDVLVTNIHDQPHMGFRNEGGYFEDASRQWGLGGWGVPFTGFGVALFDADNDGRLDGFIGNGAVNRRIEPLFSGQPYAEPDQFIRLDDEGRFRDASAEAPDVAAFAGVSRAVVAGDVDGDGDVDVLVTSNGGPARLLRAQAPSERSWTVLDLVPEGGGRHAIGAAVEVHAGGRVIRRVVRPHSGYFSSHDPRVHAGLGSAEAIEELVVRWPQGAAEVWHDLPVRRVLRLRAGQAPAFEVRGGVQP